MSLQGRKRSIPRSRAGLAAAALGCAALAVTACGSGSPSSSAPASGSQAAAGSGQAVTLTFWNDYNTTDAEASTMAKVVIPQFEKENPGIKVVSVQYPYAELLQKFLAAVAAGDAPNVLRSDIIWVPQLASQGALLPVGSLPGYSSIAAGALPGPLATTKWNGQAYALPLDTNTQALFWNKADFEAAGISGPPTTLSEMYADAAKLTVPSKQQYGLGVDGTDIWNVAPYIWSAGGALTNNSYTAATGAMNGGGTQTAVSSLAKALQAGRHRDRLPRRRRRGVGRARLPEGPVRHVHRRPVGGAYLQPAQARAGLRHRAVPDRRRRIGLHGRRRGHRDPAERGQPGGHREVRGVPRLAVRAARDGQGGPDVRDGPPTRAQEIKTTPYYSVFVQQLKTARVRPVSPGYSKLDTDFSNDA